MADIDRQWSDIPDFKWTFDKMSTVAPELVKRYLTFSMTTMNPGNSDGPLLDSAGRVIGGGTAEPIISGKLLHLIYCGVDILITHFYGGREHVRMALKAGASVQEIVETLGIAAFAGVSGYEVGFPLVRRISARLKAQGRPRPKIPRTRSLRDACLSRPE